jgi:hypothetical protein
MNATARHFGGPLPFGLRPWIGVKPKGVQIRQGGHISVCNVAEM